MTQALGRCENCKSRSFYLTWRNGRRVLFITCHACREEFAIDLDKLCTELGDEAAPPSPEPFDEEAEEREKNRQEKATEKEKERRTGKKRLRKKRRRDKRKRTRLVTREKGWDGSETDCVFHLSEMRKNVARH